MNPFPMGKVEVITSEVNNHLPRLKMEGSQITIQGIYVQEQMANAWAILSYIPYDTQTCIQGSLANDSPAYT